MAATTGIAWTDRTWNPIAGCSKVSAGCSHCYAEVMGKRLRAMALAKQAKGEDPGRLRAYLDAVDARGRWTGRVVTLAEALGDPLKWRKPARVFVNSMSDLFHPGVPFEFIAAVFGVMAAAQQHTFLVLTKRPERAREFFAWETTPELCPDGTIDTFDDCPPEWRGPTQPRDKMVAACARRGLGVPLRRGGPWPLPNVHLGVSVEDQATADARIPLLLDCPAAVRWVSYEPALAAVDFWRWVPSVKSHHVPYGPHGRIDVRQPSPCPTSHLSEFGGWCACGINWLVCGGESGPNARPFDVEWARSTVRQCKAAGVPVFVKQMGSRPYNGTPAAGWDVFANGVSCRDKAGADPSEWPSDLQVREIPEPFMPRL